MKNVLMLVAVGFAVLACGCATKTRNVEIDGKAADGIYRSDLLALGVSRLKVEIEYYALRLCGRSHCKNEKKGKRS